VAPYDPGDVHDIGRFARLDDLERPLVNFPADPGGGTDLSALLQQAQQMQARLLEAQEELARAEVSGSAGGGLVHATVTGGGEVVGLRIDPTAIDPSDAEGLADLVLAAIRDANRAAQELQQQTMGPLAEGLGGMGGGLGLPGM
jgi:DNA-binding YbaB/EbfC family protein